MERSALVPQCCDGSLAIALHLNRFASTCGIASRANRDAMEIAASLPIAALLHDVWKDSTTQALAHARAAKHDVSTRTACSTPTSAAFPAFFATWVTGMQTVGRYSQGYRAPHRAVAWTCLSGFDA
ncbi:hypothetical protein [Xanthomonas arboricola]|uniref:hypothetical protein n=1 Tax=Xanthomonas arboricola TaxID=56448 RepID=UPI0011AF783A|nr:hypothetical protein [Xanthomonas arboricola]